MPISSEKTLFYKYHGSGNDFIIIDDRSLTFSPTNVATLCHRSFGIGADGLLLLQPSECADFRMRYFNSDGGAASMCGNGLRCLIALIHTFIEAKDHYLIETEKELFNCTWDQGNVAVDFPIPMIKEHSSLYLLDTGVPHAVFFTPHFDFDFLKKAKAIREEYNANVNAAIVLGTKIALRTFERGVEGETLSCGTGAAAVAFVTAQLHQKKELEIVPLSGESLYFSLKESSFTLSGPATFVFSGSIALGCVRS